MYNIGREGFTEKESDLVWEFERKPNNRLEQGTVLGIYLAMGDG